MYGKEGEGRIREGIALSERKIFGKKGRAPFIVDRRLTEA
jgi:hypothetical protein